MSSLLRTQPLLTQYPCPSAPRPPQVSLSDFLTLFSARTHSEFFWARKPSPILLAAASLALTISTLLAALWPAGKTDGIHVKGLCLGGPSRDKMWPLWVWLYCIFWWFVQDAVKVGVYWLMEKYDIFQIRTAGLVNLRDALRTDDAAYPLARQSVAVLEARNLENKVEAAIRRVNELARLSGGGSPRLARVSQKLVLARTSATLARASVVPQGRLADMEAGMAQAGQTISEIEGAVEGLDDAGQRAALEAPLRQLQQATAKLAESHAKLAEGRGRGR
jgi:H+-transporting ATPase